MRHPAGPGEPSPTPGNEAGTTIVEFALASSLFFLMLFAVFDYGLYFNSRENIRHAVRDAGRVAVVQNSTAPLPPASCSPTGIAPSGSDLQLVCLVKSKVGNTATRVWISWPDDPGGAGSAVAGHRIRICAMYPTSASIGLTAPYIPNRVTTEVTLRLEQPFPDSNDLKETASPGTWTFCT